MRNIRLIKDGEIYRPVHEVRTCSTCAHNMGRKCALSGFYIEVERKHPTECGRDFDGWVQRPPRKGVLTAFRDWLFGEKRQEQ